MANPNVLVDVVKGIEIPPATETAAKKASQPAKITVNFRGGKSGYLDMSVPRSAVWADILESLSLENQSAYVILDPDTDEIIELQIPQKLNVGEIGKPDKEGDVEVELIISSALHFIRKNNPNFSKLLKALQDAKAKDIPVIVTENDDHEIIDVRMNLESEKGGD